MRGSFALWVAILLLSPALSLGLSFSSAPGYGSAAHLDDNDYLAEWLGPQGWTPDGVSSTQLLLGNDATLSIDVTLDNFFDVGSFEWLSVWVDWNQDKTFDNSELVFDLNDTWFDNGSTLLNPTFAVPDWALTGNTWMRVRITADGTLDPGGDFFTGEVEDYQVNVAQSTVIPEPTTLMLLAMGLLSGIVFVTRNRLT